MPVQVPGPGATGKRAEIVGIAAGCDHSLALGSGGCVWAWRENRNGQLGDGTTTSRLTPVLVRRRSGTGLCRVVEIAADDVYTVARASNGAVYEWGMLSALTMTHATLVRGPRGRLTFSATAVGGGCCAFYTGGGLDDRTHPERACRPCHAHVCCRG
jgi:alpha-tubulin suppressor-like RCC1 family protein